VVVCPARPGQPQLLQQPAALQERQAGDWAAVQPQQVEHHQDHRDADRAARRAAGAAAHPLLQLLERRPAVVAEGDDLAVQHHLPAVERAVQAGQLREPGRHVGAAAALQPHPLVVVEAERAVAVPLDLGGPRLGFGRQGGGGDGQHGTQPLWQRHGRIRRWRRQRNAQASRGPCQPIGGRRINLYAGPHHLATAWPALAASGPRPGRRRIRPGAVEDRMPPCCWLTISDRDSADPPAFKRSAADRRAGGELGCRQPQQLSAAPRSRRQGRRPLPVAGGAAATGDVLSVGLLLAVICCNAGVQTGHAGRAILGDRSKRHGRIPATGAGRDLTY
jgi:hypothetical protein